MKKSRKNAEGTGGTMTDLLFRSGITRPGTIVVKVGSRLVTSKNPAEYRRRISLLVEDVSRLKNAGVRVVIVTSGAIAHGMEALGLVRRPSTIPEKQACASIGQIRLMSVYHDAFGRHGITVGQVLLTWDDLRDKQRYLNLRNTLHQLLECGAVPVLNENDSVSVDQIKFGDNDTLGAQIALLLKAEIYVMLTDVNGLYSANPNTDKSAVHIPEVLHVSAEIKGLASETRNEISVGGMVTKLTAADMITKAGASALIGNGIDGRLLDVLGSEKRGTLFTPAPRAMSSSRRRIAFTQSVNGTIIIDQGALRAILKNGKSLLPAGVRSVNGTFKQGDTVNIQAEEGAVIARGLANYTAEETDRIKGLKTAQIERVLGRRPFEEIIHRDNLVII